MRGADNQGGDSRIRDTSSQANIEIRKGPPLDIEGYKTKYLVWPKNHPNRPDRKNKGPQLPNLKGA